MNISANKCISLSHLSYSLNNFGDLVIWVLLFIQLCSFFIYTHVRQNCTSGATKGPPNRVRLSRSSSGLDHEIHSGLLAGCCRDHCSSLVLSCKLVVVAA